MIPLIRSVNHMSMSYDSNGTDKSTVTTLNTKTNHDEMYEKNTIRSTDVVFGNVPDIESHEGNVLYRTYAESIVETIRYGKTKIIVDQLIKWHSEKGRFFRYTETAKNRILTCQIANANDIVVSTTDCVRELKRKMRENKPVIAAPSPARRSKRDTNHGRKKDKRMRHA